LDKQAPIELEFPKYQMMCSSCKQRDVDSFKLIIAAEVFAPYKVQVLALENKYIETEGVYRVNARIKWRCPSCGVSLKDITKIRDIPIELINTIKQPCPHCGGQLKLKDETITLLSTSKFIDTITLSGNLVCTKCMNKNQLTKRIKVAFLPIWNFISNITRVKISAEGIELERKINENQ